MTRAICYVCGKPADGLVDISKSVGEKRDMSTERIYLCSEHLECKVVIDSGQLLTTLEEVGTTYYGVWSGKEWYCITNGAFHTPSLAVARAQALMVTGWLPQTSWEVRAIGEDGLPAEKDVGAAVDLLASAEKRLRALPSVENAYVSVEFILQRAGVNLAPAQFAEYILGIKAAGEMITDALATRRGVSVIGSIGGTHAIDMMKEGP